MSTAYCKLLQYSHWWGWDVNKEEGEPSFLDMSTHLSQCTEWSHPTPTLDHTSYYGNVFEWLLQNETCLINTWVQKYQGRARTIIVMDVFEVTNQKLSTHYLCKIRISWYCDFSECNTFSISRDILWPGQRLCNSENHPLASTFIVTRGILTKGVKVNLLAHAHEISHDVIINKLCPLVGRCLQVQF